MTGTKSGSSRRTFLTIASKAGAAVALGAGPFITVPGKARGADNLVIVSYGGSYGDFVRDELNKPFTVKTGIGVDMVAGPDLAKVKAQVMSKNIEWDIFDGSGAQFLSGSKEGFWEPLDTNIIDTAKLLTKHEADALPFFIYTGGVAWDPAKTNPPARDFKQFWDVQKFPGRRGLRTRVSEIIEMALLADGVEPSKLYPLDLERGFKALERIKKDIKKWFEQTTQGITLIQTNECDYTYTYANRVKAAKDSGISIDFSFEQNISALDYLAVLRGSKRKEAAMRYLEFVTSPDRQAAMVEKLSIISVTKGVAEKASPAARKWVPNLNNPKSIVVNDRYWADKFIEVDKRFKEWILT